MDLLLYCKEDSGLQTIMLDGVHCAGCPGTVLVGGAGIVHIIVVAYTPGNCPPAVSTFQKTAEQVDFPAFWRNTRTNAR